MTTTCVLRANLASLALFPCFCLPPAILKAQYRITGTVLNATESTPVPNAHLTASPDHPCPTAAPAPETDTTPEARFTLTLPCSGTWRLTASAPGFAPQTYEQHGPFSTGIVLTPSQSAFDLAFRITPNSSIAGIILDEVAEPVRDAKVTLLQVDPGPGPPHPVNNTSTDDLGAYEFPNLLPGAYQVAVQAQPWYARNGAVTTHPAPGSAQQPVLDPSLDLTYPITWFPGAFTPEAASTILLTGGITQQADLRLIPVPSIHLLLPNTQAPDSNGVAMSGLRPINLQPLVRISELGQTDFHPTSVTIAPDGSLDLGGFTPGTYAMAHFQYSEGTQQDFDLTADSPRSVSYDSLKKTDHPAEPASTPPPERSRSGFRGNRRHNTDDNPPAPGLTLTGTALLEGAPAAGAMLLLIPASPDSARHLTTPREQSNTDGSFAFTHLAPGRYILLAIVRGWQLDLRTPATLNLYLVHGLPLDLTASTTLRSAISAQTPEKKPLP